MNLETKWSREPIGNINEEKDSIIMQWIDIDMYDGPPLIENPNKNEIIPGSRIGQTPIIRLYGVNENGNSILAHIHGFVPYFYSSVPPSFNENDCEIVRNSLEKELNDSYKTHHVGPRILAVELINNKTSIYGYQFENKIKLWKIYLSMPSFVPRLRSLLESNFTLKGYGTLSYQTFESNVPFILRFMIDNNISGCNWLEFPLKTYKIRTKENDKLSTCQIELDIVYTNIISYSTNDKKYSKLAPLRILSFDIECMGRKGQFPEADIDPVIQIANVVIEHGKNNNNPIIKNVFVLDTCKPIIGADVYEFQYENKLIEKWAEFVRKVDPDIITGYNIDNFDVPYLLNRGKALKMISNNTNYDVWGRLKDKKNSIEKKMFSSAQYGKSESFKTTAFGRCMFDLLPIIRRNQQLSSYSLNSVSSIFLNQQKEDVPHGIISDLQRGTDDDRHRLAVYCLKDALLPARLLQKLSYLVNYIEMARVTGVPIDFLIDRGQQIKVYSMLLRKCKTAGLVVPHLNKNSVNGANNGEDAGYEGATVIEPMKAYYTVPIATLDFASLYPSIMQAYNLCYSTLIAPSEIHKLSSDSYLKTPSGDYFLKKNKKKGILPLILEELLSARKQAKNDMKNATDPMEKTVQNGRQLALKISANSVYGFTGANIGQLPCIPIASSVTAYGRELLYKTQSEVERIFTIANGYKYNAQVIYGDTDSVMVKFGVETVEESTPLALEAAEKVTSILPLPIKLEFEKIYFPYLLMNKKRYAGLLWTKPEHYDKLDSKGLETVRRDNCLLVRKMVENILRKILIERDIDGALEYTKRLISDLLQNKMDMSLLVITKGLNKTTESDDYKVKSAHTELANRMRKRDSGSAPGLGERIAYVIIDKGKNAPLYEKAEDPVYVLENSIPIDCDYYLKNQLQNPLERIFEPIIGVGKVRNVLFSGEHTLKKTKPAMKLKSGGMMNFAVKKEKCLGCKAPLMGKNALCINCKNDEAQIYIEKLNNYNNLSHQFSKLWTQCQNCQESLHQEVLCTSRDCPIFYKRIKVQKDLGEIQNTLERFEQYNW